MTCQHFGICGGCSLINLSYPEELDRKRARLTEALGFDVPPLIPSPREASFRQKASFVFGSDARGRRLVMGHFAAGSKAIVPIEECPVQSDRANRIAFALRDRLSRANVAAADQPDGVLRHLMIRTTEDDREAVAMLVVWRNDKALRTPVRGLLGSTDAPDGFFVNVNTRPGPFMLGDETIKIGGRSHVREKGIRPAAPIDYLVSPDAFFQTNVGAARELVKLVVEAVGSASRVLDLYCGSGLFALPLAAAGATVTAVEENRQAIADLKTNASLNRVPAARIATLAIPVEDAFARLAKVSWDAVVLDPPREGLGSEVLSAVFAGLAPAKVVYVSCNPEALARELPMIRKAGYHVERVQPLDMFPHTDHIETVVTLTQRRRGAETSR